MNRLADETSPYLLQHADNPVNWWPWCDEALDLARQSRRPILLSIGYSACHWCHVMAHESFEDPEIGALMNSLFVNIKVDREERPDLDRIYQTAHQFIARRAGGWPLTMFLDPDSLRPFFGGTYFPNTPRHGMPAFPELLRKVAGYFADHRDQIHDHGQALVDAFEGLEPEAPGEGELVPAPLAAARDAFLQQLDPEQGGLGGAPKFPHATSLERLLRHWRASAPGTEPDTQALYAVALTLTRMAEGGIYDQLGGGFCRYSVDAYWEIPHFEKMLYDNGPLLALYAQMWLVSGDELYRRVANETADWVVRDLHAPGGAFFATLDADSEGEEGKFYVWTPDEARKLLAADEYAVVAARFGLDEPPNFEGRWHLRVHRSLADSAHAAGVSESAARRLLDTARSKLLAAREARVWPARDEKIIASWNGLMIRGFAIAARALQRDDLALIAAHALDFVRHEMIVDGRLMAVHKDGRSRFPAYLDDHAFLLDAVLELLQTRWDPTHLDFATWLAERLLEGFEDKDRGGFFFTAADHETLMHRSRPFADESLPAGNAVAALALNRLGHLLGETRYLDAAERTLRAGWLPMRDFPHGHAALLHALEEYLQPPVIVVVRGEAADAKSWARQLAGLFAPRRLIYAIPVDAPALPGALAERAARQTTVAYVCEGTQCSAPFGSVEELATQLSEIDGVAPA
jgi:uncharacterized protein YyaL (SSP411 family)